MIKIPYEEILMKVNEKTQLQLSEIEERVDKKMRQLAGLISKEGAAHIVANELGVKIFEQLSGKLQIKNILAGMRDVETVGKVMQVYDIKEFQSASRSGKLASIVIGDESGTIRAVLWNEQADNVLKLEKGFIIKVIGAYVKDNSGKIELHLNDRSQIIINPKGETVGEVTTTQRPTTRKEIKALQQNDNDVELLGTVVQAFDIRFYEVCPKCGKRAKPSVDLYLCNDHGTVLPAYAYVMNAVLDDGTETIRCVFFKEQVEKLLAIGKDELLKFKSSPAEFEAVKNELIGSIVKVNGRANNNSLFNRLEFVVSSVDKNPSPEEELKKVESSKAD